MGGWLCAAFAGKKRSGQNTYVYLLSFSMHFFSLNPWYYLGIICDWLNRASAERSQNRAEFDKSAPARPDLYRRQGEVLAGPVPAGPGVHHARREGWVRHHPDKQERYILYKISRGED